MYVNAVRRYINMFFLLKSNWQIWTVVCDCTQTSTSAWICWGRNSSVPDPKVENISLSLSLSLSHFILLSFLIYIHALCMEYNIYEFNMKFSVLLWLCKLTNQKITNVKPLNNKFFREGAARKTDIMRLDLSGRFAINVVNDLIVVHHQASRVN